jgi:hypothetical protein
MRVRKKTTLFQPLPTPVSTKTSPMKPAKPGAGAVPNTASTAYLRRGVRDMRIWSKFTKILEWIGHGQTLGQIWGWLGLPTIGVGAAGWAVTFFASAADGWSVTGVWLASLAAGLMSAAIYTTIAVTVAHRKAALVATAVNAYVRETLMVSDLAKGESIISGLTFDCCLIRGPAQLKFQVQNYVEFCSVPNNPDESFLTLPEGSPIKGTILLARNVFKRCQFEQITFVGTAADTRQMIGGFHEMTTRDWKEKHW